MIFKNKKISTRILVPVICATLFFSVVLYFAQDTLVKRLIGTSLHNMIEAKVADIDTSKKRIANQLLGQAALFSQAKGVLKAYQTAYQGDINNAEDPNLEKARIELRDYFASIERGYKKIHSDKNYRIHFHLPPARSLLRLWKKKQNVSDDLSSFRNTVMTISKGQHEPIKGIEIGRGGFAIRGIAPVISEGGQYLGSVELLSSYDPVVKYSVSNDKEFIAVYMNKEFLPIATRLQDINKHPVVGDKFVFVSSTDKNMTDAVLTPKVLDSGINAMQKTRIEDFMVVTFPIKNFAGKQIGVMAYVYDASDLYSTLSKIRTGIAVLCILLLLAIAGPLVWVVRKVTNQLNRAITVLDRNANQVASVSGQISNAGQSQAEGASEQAASIEETSSSLDELSSMTQQNANNASQADSLMKEANTIVEEANTSMGELTSSMEQISKASDDTSKIIKTIDEIAFQTNLLALNAAVEAARAGEAGAGFAVVADEVRNLAMRAADAAKNTSELIEDTVKKIGGGSELVTRTNDAFGKVSDSAARVGELVAEISAASTEQAQGITQINTAVSEMDTVVQQNAANAEESASAAEEMNSQAEQMKDMISDIVLLVSGGSIKGSHHADVPMSVSPTVNKRSNLVQRRMESNQLEQSSTQVTPEEVIPLDDDDLKSF
jgi:methyl-accepting chemotaxis protein